MHSHSHMAFTRPWGGFAFKDGRIRKKLTFDGVRFLMKHDLDLIPDLSIESITDRAAFSSLGKAVLFFQVAWFCLNCASRLGEHLSLSLLEVSTLAHGICTLASFAVWSYKPQNIDEPTWISTSGSSAKEVRARWALSLIEGLKLHKSWTPHCLPNVQEHWHEKGVHLLTASPRDPPQRL